MKKRVIATFSIPGFHEWPGATGEAGFLSARHRHLFFFRVEALVSDSDRQIEFLALGHQARSAVQRRFGDPAEFGTWSCENLAEWLLDKVQHCVAVEVWEDGENGARVEL